MSSEYPQVTDQQALITEVLGPRCEQFHEQCMTCLAWKMLDEIERLTAINRLRFSNDDRLRDALREIAGYVGPLDYNAEQMRALAREVLNVPGGTSAPGPSRGGETTGVNSPDVPANPPPLFHVAIPVDGCQCVGCDGIRELHENASKDRA